MGMRIGQKSKLAMPQDRSLVFTDGNQSNMICWCRMDYFVMEIRILHKKANF
jgi:hypothetical protein